MRNVRRGSDLPLTQAECDRIKILFSMYDWNTVCELGKIGSATLAKLRNRGFKAAKRPIRPMPNDFKLIADGKSLVELCAHYRCSTSTAIRWRKDAGIKPAKGGVGRMPIPDDFRFFYANHQVKECAKHFGVDPVTVRKWRDELRLPRKVAKPVDHKGWAETYFIRQAA